VTCKGSLGACQTSIIMGDAQPPTFVCPGTAFGAAPEGGFEAVVAYPPPTASDNCPGVTVECSPASGGTFPVGLTAVTCTATDAAGNKATCSFDVDVSGG
jgi:hypothetical protein